MAESIPKFRPGVALTCHAAAAITGARFVTVVGEPVGGNTQVGVPGAGARVFGVAAQDAAAGAKVGVHHSPGQVVPVEAGAALAAGDLVTPSATGVAVVAAAGNAIAGQVTQGAGLGAQALVDLGYRGTA